MNRTLLANKGLPASGCHGCLLSSGNSSNISMWVLFLYFKTHYVNQTDLKLKLCSHSLKNAGITTKYRWSSLNLIVTFAVSPCIRESSRVQSLASQPYVTSLFSCGLPSSWSRSLGLPWEFPLSSHSTSVSPIVHLLVPDAEFSFITAFPVTVW